MLSKIKNVIFDIGGVLVDLDFDRCIESFRALGFEGADKLVSCYHPAEFFGALERGEISVDEFYSRIREVSGLELSDEEICEAYCSLLVNIPLEKMQLIGRLKERGFNIYALSNINPIMIQRIYDFMRIDGREPNDYFNKMYLSYEMGVMKPTPKIYEMLIADSGVVPSETLFIDDGIKNIEMGREIGFQVYLASAKEDFSHIFE